MPPTTQQPRDRRRLGDVLVGMGLVPRGEIELAAAAAQDGGQRLGEYLARGLLLDEADLYRALAEQRGVAFATAEDLLPTVDRALAAAASRAYLQRHHALPIRRDGNEAIVATSDPDLDAQELSGPLGVPDVHPYLVTPTDFTRLWSSLELGEARPPRFAIPEDHEEPDLLAQEFRAQAYLVGLFGAILLDAIGARATDIHLERYPDEVRLRLRVDGELRTIGKFALTTADMLGLVNIIKINAELDIADRRRPQGGRFRRWVGNRPVDMRVQTQPTLHGEAVVIRLLPQDSRRFAVDELGLSPPVAARYRRLLDAPSGMMLVVGPTGSGKTTTLYAGLSLLAADEGRKVITIEDPIEYAIAHVQQTQVMREVGYDFATAMRVIVREDPDAILLGEVRDPDTALEAVRASQTGHLVLSTLHCNDAVDAVQRLYDLGLHPNSIAAELQAVFAQRLAPRICPHCREPVAPDPVLAAEVFPQGLPDELQCYRGSGCGRCDGRGLFGRIAIVEYLPVTAELRNAIAKHMPLDELRPVALRAGLVPLRDAALALVHQGVVPFETLPRILLPERLRPDRPETPFLPDPAATILADTNDRVVA